MYTIRTKELEKNSNMILSIIDGNGKLIKALRIENSQVLLREGSILSDKALFRVLKCIDSSENSQRYDAKINQWVI